MRSRLTIVVVFGFLQALAVANSADAQQTVEDDRAVIEVALKDFSKWKGATFGKFEGVLAVEERTLAQPDATAEDVLATASNIRKKISTATALAFAERNRTAQSIAEMVRGSPWAQ